MCPELSHNGNNTLIACNAIPIKMFCFPSPFISSMRVGHLGQKKKKKERKKVRKKEKIRNNRKERKSAYYWSLSSRRTLLSTDSAY